MNIPLEIYDITQRFATRIGFLPTNQEIKKLDNIKFESSDNYEIYTKILISKKLDSYNNLSTVRSILDAQNISYTSDMLNDFINHNNEYAQQLMNNICTLPFVDEGILLAHYNEFESKLYFKVEEFNKESGIGNFILHEYIKFESDNKYHWNTSYQIKDFNFYENPLSRFLAGSSEDKIKCDIISPYVLGDLIYEGFENDLNINDLSFIYNYYKYFGFSDKENKNKELQSLLRLSNYYLPTFSYINHMLEKYREISPQSDKDSNNVKNDVIYECESPETKRKFLVIGKEVTITEGVESCIHTSNIKSKKIIHRLVDVWGVRGHYRHYKSGKTVWINPYRKGIRRNDKEPVPKTYIIDSKDKKDIFDKDPIDNLF